MNKLDKQYTDLLQSILDYGVEKKDRTGTGTISIFGYTIRHNMQDGFPLLTTKKMPFKTIVTELLWFLRGDTNIKFLVDNGCNVWNGDAYKNYLYKVIRDKDIIRYLKSYSIDTKGVPTIEPYSKDEFIERIKNDDEFAKKWGELGPIYGAQWRHWNNYKGDEIAPNGFEMWNEPIDQITNLINELKTNPDSRRLMVNAWNVGEIDQMVLPPCHYGFQVYTRELIYEERYDYWFKNNYETGMEYDESNIPEFDNAYYEPTPKRAISLMWNQRSVDTFLGLPFNIASYGLLLEIIAKGVNMIPDELIGNLGDVHLYSNHIEQAKEQIGRELTLDERKQIFEDRGCVCDVWPFNGDWNGEYDGFGIPKRTREPYKLPKVKINSGNGNWHLLDDVNDIINSLDCDLTFKIKDYEFHPSIKAPLSN